nr:LysR family transcriptional regulator [Pseudoclavibacter chungangensis]
MLLRELKLRGSMSAAARERNYTHSAVSQQLAQLERETGVTLFERVGRGVRLTAAGEELVRNTETILAAVERAEADLVSSHERARGRVQLGAFASVSRSVLPEALAALAIDYPDLDVRVRLVEPDDSPTQLLARQVDAVVADAYPGSPSATALGLHTTVIGRDPVRGYLPDPDLDGDVERLRDVRWVLEPRTTGSAEWAIRTCRGLGFEPIVAYESSDMLFHLRLVQRGLAAAFLPEMVLREAAAELRPSRLLPRDQHRSILFLARSGAEHAPGLVAVREAIAAQLAR